MVHIVLLSCERFFTYIAFEGRISGMSESINTEREKKILTNTETCAQRRINLLCL